MNRDEKFAALMARIPEIVDHAVEHIADRPYFCAQVIVPHHDLCKPFAEALKEALIDGGFAIDKAHAHRISGEEVGVFISAPSYLAAKGLSLHAVYVPTLDESVTAGQQKILKEWQAMCVPTFAPGGGRLVEY